MNTVLLGLFWLLVVAGGAAWAVSAASLALLFVRKREAPRLGRSS